MLYYFNRNLFVHNFFYFGFKKINKTFECFLYCDIFKCLDIILEIDLLGKVQT